MEFTTNCLACIYTVAIMSCHILYNKNKFYRKCSYRKIQRGEFDTVAECGEFAVIEFAVVEKALPSFKQCNRHLFFVVSQYANYNHEGQCL